MEILLQRWDIKQHDTEITLPQWEEIQLHWEIIQQQWDILPTRFEIILPQWGDLQMLVETML